MDNEKEVTPLTPEEKDAFKTEVMSVIEDVFSQEGGNKVTIIEALIGGLNGLVEATSPMGGLGAEAEGGMKLPEEETE